MTDIQTAEWINMLGRFCGARDVESLTRASLRERFGFEQADVLALFGGSIIAGADVLARAMRENVAARYVIVAARDTRPRRCAASFTRAVPRSRRPACRKPRCFRAI